MGAHVLLIGGEDHKLRLPFLIALRDLGYRISVAASGDPGPFERAGFEFHGFRFNRFWDPFSDLRARRVLARLLKEVEADIAHSFDTKLGLLVPFAAMGNRRTAVVRTINGRGFIFSSTTPAALALRAAYLPLQRLAASFTAATVFQQRGDQAFFERVRLIGPGRSALIPGAGVDVEGFERARHSGAAAERLREELGMADAEIVITVTRVTRQKGVPALLAAAELVHRVRPSVRFLLVGPGESEGPFRISDAELARHAPYVVATGPRSDVPSLLAMADVFAFPSEYAEGVPRALMEAALCSLPIVATDIAGCREVIRDGWNGYLTPCGDPRRMADRILDLLGDRDNAERMARNGPDLIRDVFALDNVVALHAKLYDGLVEDRRSTRMAEAAPGTEARRFGGRSSPDARASRQGRLADRPDGLHRSRG